MKMDIQMRPLIKFKWLQKLNFTVIVIGQKKKKLSWSNCLVFTLFYKKLLKDAG